MLSFNAYGSASKENIGAHKPVWLGTVAPHAVGGVLASAYRLAGLHLPAGTPVNFTEGIITPLVAWKVLSYTPGGSGSYDTIVIKGANFGGIELAPAVDDYVQALGATFATTGKAAQVVAVTPGTGDDAGKYTFTVAKSANLGSLNEGDLIVPSTAVAAGTGKTMAAQPNGYLYNDIYLGNAESDINATGAVVDFHGEGILVDFTPAYPVKAAMKAAVPNVIQVEFPDDAFVTIS